MGYMRHNAMIVTCYDPELLRRAHDVAHRLFREEDVLGDRVAEVTPITGVSVNGYQSFMVAPDGSKEGWSKSDQGDQARAEFVAWLNAAVEEDWYFDWVEVQYGDDDLETKIIHDSDEERRKRED